jgi:hypothetical protein
LGQPLFIVDRATIDGATDLIDGFGTDAEREAAVRAADSRDRGNIIHFCRWRQIERIVAVLTDDAVQGTVH